MLSSHSAQGARPVIVTGELTPPPEQPSCQPVGSIVDGALEKGDLPVNIAHAIDFKFGALTFLIQGIVAIFVFITWSHVRVCSGPVSRAVSWLLWCSQTFVHHLGERLWELLTLSRGYV